MNLLQCLKVLVYFWVVLTHSNLKGQTISIGWNAHPNTELYPNIGIGFQMEDTTKKTSVITATNLEGSLSYIQLSQSFIIAKIPMLETMIKYDWYCNKTTFGLMGGFNIPLKRTSINIIAGLSYSNNLSGCFAIRLKYNFSKKSKRK